MSSATSISKGVASKGGAYRSQKQSPGHRSAPGQNDPQKARLAADGHDSGFRPWHFFVLASLMAATAAVVLARQSTPENLVLVSITIGAAGAAAAGFYRMLAPLATEDITIFSDPLTERQRAALEREKALVLRSIKELEFDRAMGKLSPRDFEEMSGRLRARALSLMKELDEGGAGYREIIERELNARLAGGRLKADATAAVRPTPDANDPVRLKADAAVAAGAPGSVRLHPDTDAAKTCACGTVADPDAVFCKRCGARLS